MSDIPECYQTPESVINWLQNISGRTEFFKNINVVPFGEMAFIYPKSMTREQAIKKLKKYWNVHTENTKGGIGKA